MGFYIYPTKSLTFSPGFSLRVAKKSMPNFTGEPSHQRKVALMTMDVPPPKGPLFIFGDPFLRKRLGFFRTVSCRLGFLVNPDPKMILDPKVGP